MGAAGRGSMILVKRVYLDQNSWIYLARAARGKKGAERFADAQIVLEAGVRQGQVSVPLSCSHYMETAIRRDWRSRRELGETMLAFSRGHTIAPQGDLLPGEIDSAVMSQFDAPTIPRLVRPFGVGASHAFGSPITSYRVPDEIRHRVPDVAGFEREANEEMEKRLLLGPTPEQEKEGMPGYDPLAHLTIGERYAKAKEELRARRRAAGWHKGERAKRVAMAQALNDHRVPIEESMARASLSFDALLDQGREGMSAFVAAVPTMAASAELELQREISSQKTWERQDLTDLGALAVAVAHCDVVVTERLWAEAARRSKLDEKLDTVVIARLDELPEILLSLD